MHRRLAVVIVAGLLLAQLAVPSVAQGPVYRERWGYLHLERLRRQVLTELAGRSPVDVAGIAQTLAQPDGGLPFAPPAKALAELRGVEADEAFVLRATTSLYVLPEVVDPASTVATCRSANFSVFLPFPVTCEKPLAFEVLVSDSAGEVVWQQSITRNTSIADLRMARAHVSMPVDMFAADALPDGSYVVELRTLIDGEGPREHDCRLRWPFHVLSGYQARTEAATGKARALRAELEPVQRALLDGLAMPVSSAYVGREFVVRSDAVRELERLERGLQNVADDKPVLDGMKGTIRTALPGERHVVPCTLRMDAASDRKRRAVVVLSATPAYDVGVNRPIGPAWRDPKWLDDELGDFGKADDWHVVCVQSPGAGQPFAANMQLVLAALGEALPVEGKPLLVCDREAGAVLAYHLHKIAPLVSGVVMVGSGQMPVRVFDALKNVPVRLIELSGYGSGAIDRTMTFVEQRQRDGKLTPDIARLHAQELPWTFGIPLSRTQLTEFARECFASR